MSKRVLRSCLLGIVAVLLLTKLIHSEAVFAREHLPEQQVLIVRYVDRNQLADLANRYDVVEVDAETQTVRIFSNQITRDALAAEGFTWMVDVPYTALINTEVKPLAGQTSGIPGFPCYRTIAEIYTSAETLAQNYPNLVELIDIGDSWEKTQNSNAGWDMEVLLLTNKSIAATLKSDAMFISGIHAREWAPPELNLRLAEYLLANYETDADIKWLLDYNRVHLVLSTNPDSRLQDEANQSWLWRKNTNNNYCPGGTGQNGRGADLNRNYPFMWAGGSSQCYSTYPGPSAGSEPETDAITDYARSIFPDQKGSNPSDPVDEITATGMFIDLHSYSELVLWPWGYTYNNAPNHASLRAMSYKFAYYNGYSPEKSSGLYLTRGSTDDWAYGELGVPGFCIEVGDSFHQNCNTFESEINPDNQQALLRAIKIARRPYRLTHGPEVTNLSVDPASVDPGQTIVVHYTADDTRYSTEGSGVPANTITAIQYSIDKPSWIPGSTETDIDLLTQVPVYSGTFQLSTDGLTAGRHTLFVESLDDAGNWGPPTAIFFIISGSTPTATPTHTATPTATPTHTATPTATPTHTATPTATPTHTATPTATPTHTATPTATATSVPPIDHYIYLPLVQRD